jgi:acetyl esterase/lipase
MRFAREEGMLRFLPAVVAAPMLAVGCASPDAKTDIVYDARYGSDTSMDVYLPSGNGAHRPAVLLVHGGAWTFGTKDAEKGDAQRLAASGYVAATINYRLYPTTAFPGFYQDCECALAFLRAHADDYGIDPNRIAAMGYSAGGHLVSLLGVAAGDPEIATDCEAAGGKPVAPPAAVVSGSGPEDMRRMYDMNHDTSKFFGGTPDQVPHVYSVASPIDHVAPGKPPFLFIYDWTDVEANAEMRDALVANGDDAHALRLAGGWHLFDQESDPGSIDVAITTNSPEGWIAIEDFLARTIGAP